MSIFDYLFYFYSDLFLSLDGNYELDYIEFELGVNGTTLSFTGWLAYSMTIITIILIVVFLIMFTKWLFKLFGGLFKW